MPHAFCIMCWHRGWGWYNDGLVRVARVRVCGGEVGLNVVLTVLSSLGRKNIRIYFATATYFISMLKAMSFTFMTHVTLGIIICHTLRVVNMHFRNVRLLVRLDSKASSCRLKFEYLFLNTSDTTRSKTSVPNSIVFSPSRFTENNIGQLLTNNLTPCR